MYRPHKRVKLRCLLREGRTVRIWAKGEEVAEADAMNGNLWADHPERNLLSFKRERESRLYKLVFRDYLFKYIQYALRTYTLRHVYSCIRAYKYCTTVRCTDALMQRRLRLIFFSRFGATAFVSLSPTCSLLLDIIISTEKKKRQKTSMRRVAVDRLSGASEE